MLFRWCSGSIPAMEQQQSFRITFPALKHWWIKWKILPRAHNDFLAPQVEAHQQQHTAPKARLCCCVQTETQAFSTAEISLLRQRFPWQARKWNETEISPPPSCFLTFSAFPYPSCGSDTMLYFAVGHMQESSLMSACHGLQASFSHTSGHQTKKAFALPCQGLKNFYTSGDCSQ